MTSILSSAQMVFIDEYANTYGQNKAHAARQAGVKPSSAYLWFKDDEFSELAEAAVDRVIEGQILKARMRLDDLVEDGSFQAVQFQLQALRPEMYDPGIRKQRIANEGLKSAVQAMPQPIFITRGADEDEDLPIFDH